MKFSSYFPRLISFCPSFFPESGINGIALRGEALLATWNEEAVCLTPATQTGPSGRPRVAFAPDQRHVALANAQGPEPRALHPLFPPRWPAAQGEAPPPRAHRASHVTVHAGVRQARPGGDDGGGGGGAAGWAAPTRAPQGSPCRMWGGSLGVARGARLGRPAGRAVPGAGVSTPSDVQGTLMVAVARGGPHLSAPAGGGAPRDSLASQCPAAAEVGAGRRGAGAVPL